MIIKSFEVNKINHKEIKNFLFYGENAGLKKELIEKKFKNDFKNKIYTYEESEILKNEKIFFEQILTRSFFENDKLLIISRATDKIEKIADEIIDKKIEDLVIIFVADILEKKSKLRKLFEKNDKSICVPFYPDNQKTLSVVVSNFFKNLKISMSQETINIIIDKCNSDRQTLLNELSKIEIFIKHKKNIKFSDIIRLINATENNNISELVDFCLAKNQKKITRILNDNNFSKEDTILVIRTFLSKTKRLIKLKELEKTSTDIESAISTFKPPVFWKDKELVKQQLKNWSEKNIKNLLNSINKHELLIKKNFESSTEILLNFMYTVVND